MSNELLKSINLPSYLLREFRPFLKSVKIVSIRTAFRFNVMELLVKMGKIGFDCHYPIIYTARKKLRNVLVHGLKLQYTYVNMKLCLHITIYLSIFELNNQIVSVSFPAKDM